MSSPHTSLCVAVCDTSTYLTVASMQGMAARATHVRMLSCCTRVGCVAAELCERVVWDAIRTPEALLTTINTVLDTYDSQMGSQGMLADSAALMNPEVIRRLRALQAAIRKSYG